VLLQKDKSGNYLIVPRSLTCQHPLEFIHVGVWSFNLAVAAIGVCCSTNRNVLVLSDEEPTIFMHSWF
jgi:hypothetical protein